MNNSVFFPRSANIRVQHYAAAMNVYEINCGVAYTDFGVVILNGLLLLQKHSQLVTKVHKSSNQAFGVSKCQVIIVCAPQDDDNLDNVLCCIGKLHYG